MNYAGEGNFPRIFSEAVVRISSRAEENIIRAIEAIEEAIAKPAYIARMQEGADATALLNHGPLGASISYDFHLDQDQPRLIEINTNAGGNLLNALKKQDQKAVENIWQMFKGEYQRQRPGKVPAFAVIVDEEPESQFLYSEFQLFRDLFTENGLATEIADSKALEYRGNAMWLKDKKIDLVYNRTTDFYFTAPYHAALRQAYLEGVAVFTPSPYPHRIYAHKRGLTILADSTLLEELGVSNSAQELIKAALPLTLEITPDNAEVLWKTRNNYFFKPIDGFAGKAAYRGKSISRRAWEENVLKDFNYIAQEFAPPSCLLINQEEFKIDFRAYVYAGKLHLIAARLYQGQTTNFRTNGGGFARVIIE